MSMTRLLRLAGNQCIPNDLQRWLYIGIDKFMEGQSLDVALNLSVDDTAFNIAVRDRHLQQAAEYLEPVSTSPWLKAVALSREITTFELHIWPRWKMLVDIPRKSSGLRRHLFHARRIQTLPKSARQLHRILTQRDM